jgi:hypothetical protein
MGLEEFLPGNIDPRKHKQSHLLQAVRDDEMNLEGLCYLQAGRVFCVRHWKREGMH